MFATHHSDRTVLWSVAAVAALLASCGGTRTEPPLRPAAGEATPRTPPPGAAETDAMKLYAAVLTPVNGDLSNVTGRATFIIDEREGTVRATLTGTSLSQGRHVAYYHAFPGGADASCPTGNGDADHNGVLDVDEVTLYAGQPVIPLNDDLEPDTAFPRADEDGALSLRGDTSLGAFLAQFELGQFLAAFDNQPIHLEDGVVILYGVGADAKIPDGTALLGGITLAGSIPVACGEVVHLG